MKALVAFFAFLSLASRGFALSLPLVPTEQLPLSFANQIQVNSDGTADDVLVAAHGSSGVVMVDISDPTSISEMGSLETSYAYDVEPQGNQMIVADGDGGIKVLDITDPTGPVLMGECPIDGWSSSVTSVSNDVAILGIEDAGVAKIDISDPSSPEVVEMIVAGSGINSVSSRDSFVTVSKRDSTVELYKVDQSDASTPSLYTGTLELPDEPKAAHLTPSGHLYVAAGESGLRIANAGGSSTPSEIGFYDTPGSAYDVTVAGNYAYVADADKGLRVINVTDPSTPVEVAFFEPEESCWFVSVSVHENYAYVLDMFYGIYVIDISSYILGVDEQQRSFSKPEILSVSAYPNPFNSTLAITAPTDAIITIEDIHGRQVADLGKERIWNAGDDVPSGIYILRAMIGEAEITEQVVLTR